MHSPYEVISKYDMYMAYKTYKSFLESYNWCFLIKYIFRFDFYKKRVTISIKVENYGKYRII
jgi:hypothetical protein